MIRVASGCWRPPAARNAEPVIPGMRWSEMITARLPLASPARPSPGLVVVITSQRFLNRSAMDATIAGSSSTTSSL
jgi:hypothetical protein